MVKEMKNNLYRIETTGTIENPEMNGTAMLYCNSGIAFVKLHPVKLNVKPKSESYTADKAMHYWMESYIKGAGDFMKYLIEYSQTVSSIYVDELENIIVKFCEQFGEVNKIDKEN